MPATVQRLLRRWPLGPAERQHVGADLPRRERDGVFARTSAHSTTSIKEIPVHSDGLVRNPRLVFLRRVAVVYSSFFSGVSGTECGPSGTSHEQHAPRHEPDLSALPLRERVRGIVGEGLSVVDTRSRDAATFGQHAGKPLGDIEDCESFSTRSPKRDVSPRRPRARTRSSMIPARADAAGVSDAHPRVAQGRPALISGSRFALRVHVVDALEHIQRRRAASFFQRNGPGINRPRRF